MEEMAFNGGHYVLYSYLEGMSTFLKDNSLLRSAPKSTVNLFTPDPFQARIHPKIAIADAILPLERTPKILGVLLETSFAYHHHCENVAKSQQEEWNNRLKAMAETSWGQQKETLLMTYKAVGRSIVNYAAPVWSTNASMEKIQVAARGQSKLAFLNRNLKGCPKKLRDTAYISLIRPALEYSCSVWHPHKKSNKDKIEKVQRRAARFVSNNFRRKASVSEMLHEIGWQSLDGRRQDQRLVLFIKIINGFASVETEDILTPADSRTRKNHSFKFKHLQAKCDSYRYSFFPATISSWNNLPFGIEKVDSVEGFKLKLKEDTFRSP